MTERFRKDELETTQQTVKFLETLLRASPDGILVTNAVQNILIANEAFCAFFGRDPREVVETNITVWLEQLDEHALERWASMVKRVLGEGTFCSDEFRMTTTDGVRYFVATFSLLERVATEEQGVIISIWHDITERINLKEELVKNERLNVLGQLGAGVGHELRNTLGTIKNAAYLLRMVLKEPDREIREILDIFENEIVKSNRIITDLLEYAHRKPPTLKSMNINKVVKEALSMIVVPENITLVSRFDEKLPPIVGDSQHLISVFYKIALNAVQAMPAGGQLTVRSARDELEWVSVSIIDTGIGIPKENMDLIFEPLFTTKAKGIGLGLPIAKMMVDDLKGNIEVQSEPGKGSSFIIRLPTLIAQKVKLEWRYGSQPDF